MLSILSSSAMDNGIYECVATNVIGESRQRFNVSIFGRLSYMEECKLQLTKTLFLPQFHRHFHRKLQTVKMNSNQ